MIALAAFSTSISSYAKDTEQVWPFVTVGDYAAKSIPMAKLVGDGKLILAPFVTFEQRLEYEQYASERIYDQIQDIIDYNNLPTRATDMEDIVEKIVYADFATGGKVLEPYEGEVQSEYLVNWQNVSVRLPTDRCWHLLLLTNSVLTLVQLHFRSWRFLCHDQSPESSFLESICYTCKGDEKPQN